MLIFHFHLRWGVNFCGNTHVGRLDETYLEIRFHVATFVRLQWDFMPGVRDDGSHVESNVKWFCCGEDVLNLIMNWKSWPLIQTLLDVFLIEGFLHIPSAVTLFNNKPWWRILLSFTEVEQGWNLIYWPLCVAWVLRFPKCFEGMGKTSPQTMMFFVQVRFISFF